MDLGLNLIYQNIVLHQLTTSQYQKEDSQAYTNKRSSEDEYLVKKMEASAGN